MRKYLMFVLILFMPAGCGVALVEWWLFIAGLNLPFLPEFFMAMSPIVMAAAAALSWADRRYRGRG